MSSNTKIFLFPADTYKRGHLPKKYRKGKPDILIAGNFLACEFEFKDKEAKTIARVTRDVSAIANVIFGQDTYLLQISSGTDIAFMVMAVIALDELYNDQGKGNNRL